MPGHNIAGFSEMSEVLDRTGVFGTRQYLKIVEELLEYWDIGGMTGLNHEGEKAQDRLMKVPARLARVADYAQAKQQSKQHRFAFLDGRTVSLAA